MSRKFITYWYKFLIFAGFIFIGLTGCTQPDSSDSYSAAFVKSHDLHQIETLELQEKETKETSPEEANIPAPEKLELTLEECRALTIENNLDLRVQLINPAITAERVSQQEAQFESVFSSGVSYSNRNRAGATYLDTISGSKSESTNMSLGLDVPLRTGGNISFDLVDGRNDSDASGSKYNPSLSSDFTASISQPLLRNAGKRVSTYGIQIAEHDLQITNAGTKLEVIRVIAALDRVYWRLYAARRELEVRRQQYDLAIALYEQAQRFVDAGEMAQVEVIRTEAGAAQQLEAIIISENNLRDRERELKQTLNKSNLQMNTPTVLIPSTEPDPVLYELDRSKLISVAMEQRMEMLELEHQIAQDFITIGYRKNQTLPLVTLDYQYSVNGLGANRSSSYDLLFDLMHKSHQLGLQLSVPLGNKAAESQLLQAIYQKRQRLASRESRVSAIEYEVLNAADQVEANWQRILASRQSSILEGRLYETERRQFELGLVTSTDVLQVQANLANAQSAEISALVDYQISLVDLAYATGTVFGSAKIRWEPLDMENDVK
ncbi:MAG: TolC family protein [Sedimentisphaerales bacterium]|nr:TolC family protein [Sedimentisphaerales bacterium]